MYDPQEKARRDYLWMLACAREEGFQQGLREAYLEQVNFWVLMGKVRALQWYLGDPERPASELKTLTVAQLSELFDGLEARLRSREV